MEENNETIDESLVWEIIKSKIRLYSINYGI